MNREKRLQELYAQSLDLTRQREALDKEIEEVRRGCGKRLAPGQSWGFCAGSDFGSAPSFCTECGGDLKLAEPTNGDI